MTLVTNSVPNVMRHVKLVLEKKLTNVLVVTKPNLTNLPPPKENVNQNVDFSTLQKMEFKNVIVNVNVVVELDQMPVLRNVEKIKH